MPTRLLVLAALFTLALTASALAAAKPGSYSGTSVNDDIYRYGDIEPQTDKGKVTFTVKSNRVLKFKVAGQEFMCGAGPQTIPVTVAKIKLSSTGRGKGTYTDPNVGAFKVAIKVTSRGRASGTITPTGLCNGAATFTAKRR
jgi:hypothetical protein